MMLPRHMFLALTVFLLAACNNNKPARPATALETGRVFIRASLDGDFKTAGELLIPDSANRDLFDSYRHHYQRMPVDSKENYRKASYEINKLTEPNDSTLIINYSNSFMRKPMEVRVVKRNGLWMVDFESIYENEWPGN